MIDSLQMRRNVDPGPATTGLQDLPDHRRDRALAFGSGNVDDWILKMRIAQPLKNFSHVSQFEMARRDRQLPFVVDPSVKTREMGLKLTVLRILMAIHGR